MKVIEFQRFGSPSEMKIVNRSRQKPGVNEVLVKTAFASVNFADTLVRQGNYPVLPELPGTPGLEASGTVESVGENVRDIEPGQRVVIFTSGCYSEEIIVDAKRVFPIPEKVSLKDAAAIQINYLTAYHMMFTQANLQAGDTMLVKAAAGGVGTAIVQLGKLSSIRSIGLVSSDPKAEYAKQQGCSEVIQYKKENVTERVMNLTDDLGVDLVLDSVQGDEFENNFNLIKPFGRIIWYGAAGGASQCDLMNSMRMKAGVSPSVGLFNFFTLISTPHLYRKSLAILLEYLVEGKIGPVISKVFPLEEATDAHILLESGKVTGKLLLQP